MGGAVGPGPSTTQQVWVEEQHSVPQQASVLGHATPQHGAVPHTPPSQKGGLPVVQGL